MIAASVVCLNLGLFLLLVSLPAFQAAHHHWIFPALAGSIAVQWGLSFALARGKEARGSLLGLLLFLLVMGILRHATILACFERCAFKLSAAAAIAAAVFGAQGRLGGGGWWNPSRSDLAALGAAVWASALALSGLRAAGWLIDASLVGAGLVLWLGRSRAAFLLASLGALGGAALRRVDSEPALIGLGLVWSLAPLAAVDRVEAWLRARPAPSPLIRGPWRAAAMTLLAAGLGVVLVGPTFLTTDRASRRARLETLSPAFPVQDPKTLSPLAARLRAHVLALSGERDAFSRERRERARDYVAAEFRRAGYAPKTLAYAARGMPGVKDGVEFHNVEALLPARGTAWVLGAHYDTAPGTPGADDNASGVAVLLEAARLLKARRPAREVRFVAFGTEEPPAFGTRSMGSWRYARALKDGGARVFGMISLEMLGCFNPRPGAQLYPPFLHLFFPDHGDYVSVTSNLASRRLLGRFARAWRRASSFPLESAVLPGTFANLAMSDQLNFWDLGFPALMLSDTGFYRNPRYHEADDLPDTLDYEKMAAVTRALVAAVEER